MINPNSKVNRDKIRVKVSKLLGIDSQKIACEYNPSKYSAIYRIRVANVNSKKDSYILKEIRDPSEFHFYESVLEPYKLDSPKMYGFIDVDHRLFMVMEEIPQENNHLDPKKKYELAIDWLIRKDSMAYDKLHYISSLSLTFIETKIWGTKQWLELICNGMESGIHPRLTEPTFRLIRTNFNEVEYTLKRGRQTLCHNDFQMGNILFRSHKESNRIYVIDWTYPNIASVCIDLATLTHAAPASFKPYLLDRYRSQIDFEEFDEIYKCAESYAKLCDFAWMVDSLMKGLSPVDMKKFEVLLSELKNVA